MPKTSKLRTDANTLAPIAYGIWVVRQQKKFLFLKFGELEVLAKKIYIRMAKENAKREKNAWAKKKRK